MKLTKEQIIEQEQAMDAFLKAREDADEVSAEQQDADADWEVENGGDWDFWGV